MIINAELQDNELDSNYKILAERVAAYNKKKGPRVGDWLRRKDGSMSRLTHDWGDSIQDGGGRYGRFYLGHGYLSYSGSLNPSVPVSKMVDTGDDKAGSVWFFKDNEVRAHNGIEADIMQRVYEEKDV